MNQYLLLIVSTIITRQWVSQLLRSVLYRPPSGNKRTQSEDDRIVAGYVRQSFTRDEDDTSSPERQVANIEAAARRFGLKEVRFFVDASGHKSGTDVKDRPAWKDLETLILAGKVKTLITNDLSRLHRKQWRVAQLIEWLEKFNVRLILAGLERDIDMSTIGGKLTLLFISTIDEYYAIDIATRVRESINNRQEAGITVSQPPFGTSRNRDGYLCPSQAGAWLLPDGTHLAGQQGEPSPDPSAIWRGYYECAKRVLELYSHDRFGLYQISYEIAKEGWAFRNKYGEPRAFRREDVRRIVANWPAYAGLVYAGKAQKRRPGLIPLDWEDTTHAVIRLELLRKVAKVEYKRSKEDRASGSVKHAYPYAFVGHLYCAQCCERANMQNNLTLKRRLTGTKQATTRRYKHPEGVECNCTQRSVSMSVVEEQFANLLRSLQFQPAIVEVMLTQAQKLTEFIVVKSDSLEAQRRAMIKRCKQRLQNATRGFADAEIDSNTYKQRKQQIEEDIRKLESLVINPAPIKANFLNCVKIVIGDLAQLWQIASPGGRQLLVRLMFEELIYDLDEQKFVKWTLCSWAKQLLSNDQGHDM